MTNKLIFGFQDIRRNGEDFVLTPFIYLVCEKGLRVWGLGLCWGYFSIAVVFVRGVPKDSPRWIVEKYEKPDVVKVADKLYREENPLGTMDTPSYAYEQVEKSNKRRIAARSRLPLSLWYKFERETYKHRGV